MSEERYAALPAPLVNREGAARLLSISMRALDNLIARRTEVAKPIPFCRVGRSIRFDPRRLQEWLAELEKLHGITKPNAD